MFSIRLQKVGDIHSTSKIVAAGRKRCERNKGRSSGTRYMIRPQDKAEWTFAFDKDVNIWLTEWLVQSCVCVAVGTDRRAQHAFPLKPAQQLQMLRREHRPRALAHQQHVAGFPPRLLPQRPVSVEEPHVLVALGWAQSPRLLLLVSLACSASRAFFVLVFIRISTFVPYYNNIISFKKFICTLIENDPMFFGFISFFEWRL